MSSDSKPLKPKKDTLKERILNEMVVPKEENFLADYEKFKLSQALLLGLTEAEALELNEKGFVSIDPENRYYFNPVKLFDTTNYAVTYCRFCKEDQPISFSGHHATWNNKRNSGILIFCDECNRLLFCLDHIANGGVSS